MDTSEQYIKMCEKAEEIQALRKRRPSWMRPGWEGHVTVNPKYIDEEDTSDWDGLIYAEVGEDGKRDVDNWCASCAMEYGNSLSCDATWLPRQDELQKMADEWWKKNGSYGEPLIKGLYDFAMSFGYKPFREDELPINSWEQLWLGFVMKEKFGKVWDGEKWVK